MGTKGREERRGRQGFGWGGEQEAQALETRGQTAGELSIMYRDSQEH